MVWSQEDIQNSFIADRWESESHDLNLTSAIFRHKEQLLWLSQVLLLVGLSCTSGSASSGVDCIKPKQRWRRRFLMRKELRQSAIRNCQSSNIKLITNHSNSNSTTIYNISSIIINHSEFIHDVWILKLKKAKMEAPHNTSTSRAQHASRRWASSVGIGMSLQRNNEQARNQSGPTANVQLVQLVSEWVSEWVVVLVRVIGGHHYQNQSLEMNKKIMNPGVMSHGHSSWVMNHCHCRGKKNNQIKNQKEIMASMTDSEFWIELTITGIRTVPYLVPVLQRIPFQRRLWWVWLWWWCVDHTCNRTHCSSAQH